MRRECKYVLDENEITCVGDIRKARDSINRTILNIDNLSKEEISNILESSNKRLAVALEKLEINWSKEWFTWKIERGDIDDKKESLREVIIHDVYSRLDSLGYGKKQSGAGYVYYIVNGEQMTVSEYTDYCIKMELKKFGIKK